MVSQETFARGDHGRDNPKKAEIHWTLRKKSSGICKNAIFWTLEEKRKRERPKIMWRRTTEEDLGSMGLSWAVAQKKAQNCKGFGDFFL